MNVFSSEKKQDTHCSIAIKDTHYTPYLVSECMAHIRVDCM